MYPHSQTLLSDSTYQCQTRVPEFKDEALRFYPEVTKDLNYVTPKNFYVLIIVYIPGILGRVVWTTVNWKTKYKFGVCTLRYLWDTREGGGK